jgi:DNA-binding transcriptional regulator YdaS (Cro superfamily)
MKKTPQKKQNKGLMKAIKVLGNQSNLAKAIGTNQQNVSWWVNKSGVIPAEFVLIIEQVTKRAGNEVSRHELRTDLYPKTKGTNCEAA